MLKNSKKLFVDAKKVIPSGVNSPVRYFEPYPFFYKKKPMVLIFGTLTTKSTLIFAMVMVLYFWDIEEKRLFHL